MPSGSTRRTSSAQARRPRTVPTRHNRYEILREKTCARSKAQPVAEPFHPSSGSRNGTSSSGLAQVVSVIEVKAHDGIERQQGRLLRFRNVPGSKDAALRVC